MKVLITGGAGFIGSHPRGAFARDGEAHEEAFEDNSGKNKNGP